MDNIFVLDKPNKVEWIYKHLKKFCKKGKTPYKSSELAHWLREHVEKENIKVIVYKGDDSEIKGFAIFFLIVDMNISKTFVMGFYSEAKEAKKAMVKYILDWSGAKCVDSIEMVTYHEPDVFKKMFGDMEELSKITLGAYVFELPMEE